MNLTRSQILTIVFSALLVLWGAYATIVYFGIPVHGSVLMNGQGQEYVNGACENTQFFCRGLRAIVPSISYAIGRSHNFLAYGITWAILYVVLLGFCAMKSGRFAFTWRWKPWHLLGIFVFSMWLLFTVLTGNRITVAGGDLGVRDIVEPHASVYQNAPPEAFAELSKNFENLKESNCLTLLYDINPNSSVYQMKSACVHKFFITRVVSELLFILFLCMVLLSIGRAVWRRLNIETNSVLAEAVFSFALGAAALIAVLWLMAVLHLYIAPVAWIVVLGLLAACYKHARYWLEVFLKYEWTSDRPWYSLTTFFAWLLISWLALNFLVIVRPFPIGWDDLGVYLNLPRLLVSYGAFIGGMGSFEWEYITSLGYLLFGYENIFSGTTAMLINWLAGPWAVFVVILTCTLYFGPGTGIMAGLLYYALPMVGHFSFADMKTDNAVFGFQAMALLAAMLYLFPRGTDEEDVPVRNRNWLIVSGILVALAFGTKATSAMVVMSTGALIAGVMIGGWAFFGSMLMAFCIYAAQGVFSLADVSKRVGISVTNTQFMIVAGILGLACLGYAYYRNPDAFKAGLRAIITYGVTFLVCVIPWLAYNNIVAGNFPPSVILEAPSAYTPVIDIFDNNPDLMKGQDYRSLPPELALDPDHASCKSTARTEELDRYWGFREGWGHYLTLTWRSVMNIDSAGYYVTTIPMLLLFPLLLLLPAFWRKDKRWLRWLTYGTFFMILQWTFLANGILWYGIMMFWGLIIGIEALWRYSPMPLTKGFTALLILLSLGTMYSARMWQFGGQRSLLEYTMGKASAEVMRERTIPHYNNVADIVLDRYENLEGRPYVYRVGTFIPYFIPRNLEVIGLTDHQLDRFNCLYQERDKQLTLKRLKALGFNSIVFDTNTATIERDPNGSLHQKVNAFVDFLNSPDLGFNIVINDTGAGIAFVLIE